MPVDLDALEKLAAAATPGGWYLDTVGADGSDYQIVEPEHHRTVAASAGADAAFIAAANPAVVLGLCQEVRRLRAALSKYGRHPPNCASLRRRDAGLWRASTYDCTCGLDAAIADGMERGEGT